MKNTIFPNTIETLSFSKKYISLLFFIFIFGISTGVFFEILMRTDMKSDMQYYLQTILISPLNSDINSVTSLISSIITNIIAIIFITLSGYTKFSCPASSIILFLKGLSLGYCCALILETLAFKGVFVILLSLLPQNALLLPSFFISACIAINKTSTHKYKKNKGIVQGFNVSDTPYLYANAFLCIIVIVSCIIQSICLPIAARIL